MPSSEPQDARMPHERQTEGRSSTRSRDKHQAWLFLSVAERHPWVPLDQLTPELAVALVRMGGGR